jgi:hypothetical protein
LVTPATVKAPDWLAVSAHPEGSVIVSVAPVVLLFEFTAVASGFVHVPV